MRWTNEEVEYLKENYNSQIPLIEISKKLNKSIKAIKHKAARLELSRPFIPHNKPKNKAHRNIYDKNYYEKNKKRIYNLKKQRWRNRKKELVKLLGGKCKFCGYERCLWALDFHHTGEKEREVSKIKMEGSKDKALKEAKKCILLCANCHRELHHKKNYGDII